MFNLMKNTFSVDFKEDLLSKIKAADMDTATFLNSAISTYLYLLTETNSNPNLQILLVDGEDYDNGKVLQLPTVS